MLLKVAGSGPKMSDRELQWDKKHREREKQGWGGGHVIYSAEVTHIHPITQPIEALVTKKLDSKFFTSKGGHSGISPRLAHHNKSQYISKSDYHVKLREDQQTSNAYTHYIYCISCE